MGLSIITCTDVAIICDSCDNTDLHKSLDGDRKWPGVKSILFELRADGWRIGKKTLCPDCSGKKAERGE